MSEIAIRNLHLLVHEEPICRYFILKIIIKVYCLVQGMWWDGMVDPTGTSSNSEDCCCWCLSYDVLKCPLMGHANNSTCIEEQKNRQANREVLPQPL
jgi:hypothetical protein